MTNDSTKNNISFIIGILFLLTTISAINGIIIDNPQYRVDGLVPNETSPNIVHPGDDVDVWFKITNDNYNDEIKDIKVTITPHYPFELKQVNPVKGTATISHLNVGESDTAYFKLHVNEDAPSRDYRIDVHVTGIKYKKENGKIVETTINFTKIYHLPVYGVARFEFKADKNSCEIIPSDTGVLNLTLKNEGTGIAKYISVELSGTENVNIVGPTTYYLNYMKPNENKKISTKIYATTKAEDGVYSINAKISWIGEDGQECSSTIPINIKVVKSIYPSQVFLYLDSYKYDSKNSEITIGVANRGSTTIRHCVLEISGVNEVDNNYVKYVGDLDEDDYDTVSYDVVGKLNKTIPVKVKLTYFDDYHNEYNITKTFNVSFNNYSTESSNNSYYYMALVVAIIILIIYGVYRHKKKKNEKIDDFEE